MLIPPDQLSELTTAGIFGPIFTPSELFELTTVDVLAVLHIKLMSELTAVVF